MKRFEVMKMVVEVIHLHRSRRLCSEWIAKICVRRSLWEIIVGTRGR